MAGADPVTAHPLSRSTDDAVDRQIATRRSAGVGEWAELARALAEPTLVAAVDAAGRALVGALRDGRTLLVCGNGGSAAMASHVAAEFLGRCIADREPLPAVCLAESISTLTAVGNDFGFDEVFARGVRALGRPGDVLLALSTSGNSANVVRAVDEARARGLTTIAMTGAGGGLLADRVDHALAVPSTSTPRIQEAHLLWAHVWCEAVDLLSAP